MSKFRYYITDLFDGCIKGSNDENIAKQCAECTDFFVLDSETGLWLTESGKTIEVKEIENPGA